MEPGPEEKPSLTGAERGKLRSLAQTLDPKVFVGKAGVNAGIAKLLDDAFRNADLVKVGTHVKFAGNPGRVRNDILWINNMLLPAGDEILFGSGMSNSNVHDHSPLPVLVASCSAPQ